MSLHQGIDYIVDADDEDRADNVMERFMHDTNAAANAANFQYVVSEKDGNFFIDEFGTLDSKVNARRIFVDDDGFVEEVLNPGRAEELREEYSSYSGFTL